MEESDSLDYIKLPFKDCLNKEPYRNSAQASHCMIFARNDKPTFGHKIIYNPRAAVLMQMRFDGVLGFPGGLVDAGESPVQALNRELSEEMDLDLAKHAITDDSYIVSHWIVARRLCLHFYALEVSLADIPEIEKRALAAKDYGSEVLGTVRVPLYTLGDGYRGFPAFLSNAFIGNSKVHLEQALLKLNIMTADDIKLAKKAVPQPLPVKHPKLVKE